MSLSSEVSSISYEGNNSTSLGYAIPFTYHDATHVKVSVTDSDGAVTVLDTSEYEVGDNDEVVTQEAWDDTYQVTVYRELPLTQTFSYTPSGPFPSANTERALDRQMMVAQQHERKLGQTLRFQNPATAATELANTPNTIIGLDNDGVPTLLTSTEVRELAQLEGGDAGMPVATVADSTARDARVPDYLGQLLVQRDEQTVWIATGLNAGDWAFHSIQKTVRTAAELEAALTLGGAIGVHGTITKTTPTTISVDWTWLFSISDSDGNPGKIVRTHASGADRPVLNVDAGHVRISGLELTTGHPLTSDRTDADSGIEITGSDAIDVSGLIVENCHIHHVTNGITRLGDASSTLCNEITVTGCRIHSFVDSGMYLEWNFSNPRISHNRIYGRDVGELHEVSFNGIWLGNYGDFAHVLHNEISEVDRHGIEYWNNNADGNRSAKICFNNIHDLPASSASGGFGITALGCGTLHVIGNSLENIGDAASSNFAIGIELVNDPINTSRTICTGNVINNVLVRPGGLAAIGISCDSVVGALVAGNTIGYVGGKQNSCFGLNIANGSDRLTIRNNVFDDAGNIMIRLEGLSLAISNITQAANGVITVPSISAQNRDHAWYTGAKVRIIYVGGMTELNNTVKTMTIATDTTITVATNTTGFGAYSGSGFVVPRVQRLTITDNTFFCSQVIDSSTLNYAIHVYLLESAMIARNTVFVESSLLSTVGLLLLEHDGIIYAGHSDEAPIEVHTSPGAAEITGTNNRIAYTAAT